MAEQERINAPDDFWASVGATDAKLIRSLVDYLPSSSKDLHQEFFEGLADDYKTAWRRYGSARELNSVIEQYAFLAAMLRGTKRHKKLSGYLTSLISSLDAIAE